MMNCSYYNREKDHMKPSESKHSFNRQQMVMKHHIIDISSNFDYYEIDRNIVENIELSIKKCIANSV